MIGLQVDSMIKTVLVDDSSLFVQVLKLASLLDNPEEKQKQINAANSQVEELDEDAFEDPFDTR